MQFQWTKNNDAIGTTNRGNICESGLCTLCESDCKGKCETWLSCMAGRKLLYPRNFGNSVSGSGNTTHVGVNYNALRINGFCYGSKGMPSGLSRGEDDCIFPNASIETSFGKKFKTKARVPLMTGALGSTFIAAKYWDSFATGAALVGFPIVVGENVVGVDPRSEISKGKISKAPELDRRIESFLRYYDGYGAIIVQLNVEDTRNGVAEYVVDKYGDKVIIELKWGQGAKDIGGEIQVKSLDYALFLKERGYVVDPDPDIPEVQEAFWKGAIRSFARHSRLGYPGLSSAEEVEKNFKESVAYLRKIGYERISLKTGAYGMEALAMAMKFATDTELDLLTIDGSGGGTGMSPWNMMEAWGVPSIHLHAKAYQYARILEAQGKDVVDLSFAGGLVREDHIFKALALGAPFAKLICMGRALMIPAFLGSNIEGVLHPERREETNGNWDKLPGTVKAFGETEDEIFTAYHEIRKKVGNEEIKNVPFGAIASWTLADKLAAGLQQFMAGARKFSLSEISRADIFSANRETEKETGIPFMTDLEDEAAMKILKG
uniref:Glutamate synthase (NADPH) GltB2 subunit n=1 Tax=Candidatus Kentrum sp. SD TaxID=2126332 RepID=A0A450YZ15_9GAMM|nr:MAG: glutamate synthase (NADPH) GltB2 subunit [Candidatus Kentron sp. SD]VFK46762.1 MAG: glutamate synthase (NADPH) GltB2 subunit [Candidatus Kentron sp. SD]VFK80214.1 MAG: glutamate synthase (NADPH) GltB2 subunit [Candidatus Kentron sp. SD]